MTDETPEQVGPELAPLMIEEARSSRSRCRTCRRKIDKGKLRIGILLEGPYGTGYLWHHLTCAAKKRLEDVENAYATKAHEQGLELPPLDELRKLKEKAEEAKATKREAPYAERAPSGRSKCKHCGEAIEQGAFRVALLREVRFGNQVRGGPITVHPRCVAAELRAEDCMTEVDGFEDALRANTPDLSEADAAELLAQIGELG
jgi:hypothetical protein